MRRVLFTGVYQVFDDYIFTKFADSFQAETVICTGSKVEDFQISGKIIVIPNAPLNKDVLEYSSFLIEIIKNYHIDLVVPMVDSEVQFLSRNRFLFDCDLFIASDNTIEWCLDKVKSHEILCDIAPSHFKITNPNSLIKVLDDNPNKKFVIRPFGMITGSGKGMRILSKDGASSEERILTSLGSREVSFNEYFEAYKSINRNPEYSNLKLILTEYLPGQEYSCYLTSDNGVLVDVCINKKVELESGTTNTARAVIISSSKIEALVAEISKRLDLHLVSNIQLKEDSQGELKLIEVNPRIAGSIMLPLVAGYDLFGQSRCILDREAYTLFSDIKDSYQLIRVYKEFFLGGV